jgi:hypothetical protein
LDAKDIKSGLGMLDLSEEDNLHDEDGMADLDK